MSYTSCYFIEQFSVVFNNGLGFCCKTGFVSNRPKWDLYGITAARLVDNMIEHRRLLIETFRQDNQMVYHDCKGCKRLEYNDWDTSEKVTYVNFSYYPAPCNCKCIYCNVWGYLNNSYKNCKEDIIIPKFLEIVSELRSRDLFSDKCEVQISPGEITIHPYKEELLDALPGFRYRIFTNASTYDKKIAEVLQRGKSEVFVSLDSGTRETYNKVKGMDCFEKVIANLKRYNEDGTVFLKYILLPGINDSDEDIAGFLDIVKKYGGNRFKLARDSREKNISEAVYWAAARFIARADDKGTVWYTVYFNQQEQTVLGEYIRAMSRFY